MCASLWCSSGFLLSYCRYILLSQSQLQEVKWNPRVLRTDTTKGLQLPRLQVSVKHWNLWNCTVVLPALNKFKTSMNIQLMKRSNCLFPGLEARGTKCGASLQLLSGSKTGYRGWDFQFNIGIQWYAIVNKSVTQYNWLLKQIHNYIQSKIISCSFSVSFSTSQKEVTCLPEFSVIGRYEVLNENFVE